MTDNDCEKIIELCWWRGFRMTVSRKEKANGGKINES